MCQGCGRDHRASKPAALFIFPLGMRVDRYFRRPRNPLGVLPEALVPSVGLIIPAFDTNAARTGIGPKSYSRPVQRFT